MKSIEFRAWDEYSKEMFYGVKSLSNYKDSGSLLTRPWIYMQYVGLTTKDGTKIFEGDILGGQYENGWIAYCEVCKSFQYHAVNECFACIGDVHWYELVEDDGKLEVLGNIYENSNLLEML